MMQKPVVWLKRSAQLRMYLGLTNKTVGIEYRNQAGVTGIE